MPLPVTESVSRPVLQQILDDTLGEAERLADAQTRAVEQHQDGGVAQVEPGLALLLGRRFEQLLHVAFGERLGHRARQLGRLDGADAGVVGESALVEDWKKERTDEKARAVEVRARP